MPWPRKQILKIAGFLLVGGIAVVSAIWYGKGAFQMIASIINKNTHPALLLTLYAILPIVGFPISLFLIVFGIKFGAVQGNVLMFAGLPLHLLVSYLLAQSVLGPWIQKIAEKWGFTVPQVPPGKGFSFSFVFMLFPGLPYSLKNYMLALSGVSFPIYFSLGWLINGLMGIPIVILGDAAGDWNLLILGIAVLIFTAIALGRIWIKKRFQKK